MSVRCTATTKAGPQCSKVATRVEAEGGERLLCATHAPEEWLKDVPLCEGLMRNGMPCKSSAAGVVVFQDVETVVCSTHEAVHGASDGKTLQTPPRPRTPKAKRLAQETTLVGETKSNGGAVAAPRAGGSLRERLVTTTEDMYEQITSALEDVISNAKKRRATACPSCGHRFSILVPDYASIVAAANSLLAKTVTTSGTLEEETARIDSAPPEVLAELSTADLKRLLRSADWTYAQAEAEAETLEETITRHLDVLLDYAETRDVELLPRARFAKREVFRLRGIHERLSVVAQAELPLLPGERPPYEGTRPRLDGSHRSESAAAADG